MASLLNVRGLTKVFGGFHAVDGVDLDVQDGEIHALIGPNGAGKSTIFNLITGHLRPTTGAVTFVGREITGGAPHLITRSGIARAFQLTNVFPRLTVEESIKVAILARRRRTSDFVSWYHHRIGGDVADVLKAVGLEDVRHQQAKALSHGDQRALEIGLALATDPRLLLLDEPTAGMSPYETDEMVALVKRLVVERGLTIFLCEHDMNVVFRLSDRVTVLHEGRVIAEGSPSEVRHDAGVKSVYLGTS